MLLKPRQWWTLDHHKNNRLMEPRQALSPLRRQCLYKLLQSQRLQVKYKQKQKLSQHNNKSKLKSLKILKLPKPLQWVSTQTSSPTSLQRCEGSSSKTNPSEQPIQENLSQIGHLKESQKQWMWPRSSRQFKILPSGAKC